MGGVAAEPSFAYTLALTQFLIVWLKFKNASFPESKTSKEFYGRFFLRIVWCVCVCVCVMTCTIKSTEFKKSHVPVETTQYPYVYDQRPQTNIIKITPGRQNYFHPSFSMVWLFPQSTPILSIGYVDENMTKGAMTQKYTVRGKIPRGMPRRRWEDSVRKYWNKKQNSLFWPVFDYLVRFTVVLWTDVSRKGVNKLKSWVGFNLSHLLTNSF